MPCAPESRIIVDKEWVGTGPTPPSNVPAGWTMTVTFGYVILSVTVSGGIGMIAGIYPAFKASRLDPIVALARK